MRCGYTLMQARVKCQRSERTKEDTSRTGGNTEEVEKRKYMGEKINVDGGLGTEVTHCLMEGRKEGMGKTGQDMEGELDIQKSKTKL